MAKRFSGDVRLTISKRELYDDEYDIKLKAPGCSPHEGVSVLQDGYTQLHGQESAIDNAACRYLQMCAEHDDLMPLVAKAAKDGTNFHVGRDKANRWPGGPSNLKTKRGRRR